MSIRDAFIPAGPDDVGVPFYVSIQASLYNRLRRSRGKAAGSLGWLLVRLGQPGHREHAEAVELVSDRPTADLAALSLIVGAARAAARTAPARELCDAILLELDTASVVSATRALQAQR